jgi:hypothetical protein
MDKPFWFRIERTDLRLRFMQSRAIHVMAALFLLLYAMQYFFKEATWLYKLMILPPPLTIIGLVIFKRKLFEDIATIRMFRILEIGFLIMGCMHFLQHNQSGIAALYFLIALFIALIFYMEMRLFNPQFVLFYPTHIEVPTLWRTRHVTWKSVDHVVLRRPHLTILFPKDRYMQWQVETSQSEPSFEEDFKHFCAARCLV